MINRRPSPFSNIHIDPGSGTFIAYVSGSLRQLAHPPARIYSPCVCVCVCVARAYPRAPPSQQHYHLSTSHNLVHRSIHPLTPHVCVAGQAVVNIHLGRNFGDTSTAFFRARSGQESCVGGVPAIRACKNLIDHHTTFNVLNNKRLSEQPTDRRCGDTSDRCVEWARAGMCSAKVESMYRDCKQSCGVCGGLWLGPHVPGWSKNGGVLAGLYYILLPCGAV